MAANLKFPTTTVAVDLDRKSIHVQGQTWTDSPEFVAPEPVPPV